MELGLITIMSALHDKDMIDKSHEELLEGLGKRFILKNIESEDAKEVDMPIVFIASGGTEEKFMDIYEFLPHPIILLTDGLHNSLAASMEIQTYIKRMDGQSEILHGNIEYIENRIKSLYKIFRTRRKIQSSIIGVIGSPSPWLIASHVDYIKAKKRWGIRYKDIEINNLYKLISDMSVIHAEEVARDFIGKARGIKETNEKDIVEAAKIYLALKELYKENSLDAATLRCFDLLDIFNNTGCLALSLLNDDNFIAGCEGDGQSIFSMYLLKLLTDEIPFMANPAYIDTDKSEIILAHCTVATSITKEYMIRNHFESQIGVGIQGIIEEGPVTIFKCGGVGLDSYFVAEGEIVDNLENPNRCRTQLKVKMKRNIDYFLRNPIANHHIIIKGNYVDLIIELMDKMRCWRV